MKLLVLLPRFLDVEVCQAVHRLNESEPFEWFARQPKIVSSDDGQSRAS